MLLTSAVRKDRSLMAGPSRVNPSCALELPVAYAAPYFLLLTWRQYQGDHLVGSSFWTSASWLCLRPRSVHVGTLRGT